MAPPKLIGYLVIFLNLEKHIIYLKSPQNPQLLYTDNSRMRYMKFVKSSA